MRIWDSVNCTPLRIFADGRTAILYLCCTVISQLFVNFIPDHATKHRYFIVTLERLSIYFWNMGKLPSLQYSRIPLKLSYDKYDFIFDLMKKQCDIYETEATVYHAHTCNTNIYPRASLIWTILWKQCILWNYWNKTYLSLISGVHRIFFQGEGGGGGVWSIFSRHGVGVSIVHHQPVWPSKKGFGSKWERGRVTPLHPQHVLGTKGGGGGWKPQTPRRLITSSRDTLD